MKSTLRRCASIPLRGRREKQSAQGAQVLFTSEMMFNFDPQLEFTDEFRAIAAETDTYIFIAYSVLKEGEPGRNQAVLLSPDGNVFRCVQQNSYPAG